ncbi:hypothetical protein EPICR_20241 [Candidatus Desulfarcum epimagneticum]|uniref:Uncharacterized protein n=1 Tax=uncultured Desulfobacteraceae bacterium TaxID=218296 RepID=A0A484HH85_9BACT|nr:hypothetical protein EPICR_20241 [uncultured Desulfobacteraceae bacterium]
MQKKRGCKVYFFPFPDFDVDRRRVFGYFINIIILNGYILTARAPGLSRHKERAMKEALIVIDMQKKGVDFPPGNMEKTLKRMKEAAVQIIPSGRALP